MYNVKTAKFKKLPHSIEYPLIFSVGCPLYGLIEIMWRGHTHWTMLLTGGACVTCMYFIGCKCKCRFLVKCLLTSACITAIEFAVGCIVNIALKWNVWDYSARAFNVLGQICPLYSLFWFLLSVPAIKLSAIIKKCFE